MYHRVLPREHPERKIEQPGMYVSDTTLDMHMTLLKRHFEIVHLADWVRRAGARQTLPSLACAITFDDGWRDNYDHAFPILKRHAAPATVFLVSSLIGTDREFWPNQLARRLATAPLDQKLAGPLNELLAPVRDAARARGKWTIEDSDRATTLAKQVEESQIRLVIDEAFADGTRPVVVRSLLNPEELRIMSSSGLIRFGSHSRTHYRLRGDVPRDVLENEIVTSSIEIRSLLGTDADLFCYPNGDTTEAAVEVVRQHYIGAVTTQKGWCSAGSDLYQMSRIGVHEDISDRPASFLARLSGFL